MERILFERGSFAIKLRTVADSDIVDLLAGTLWGTPGKLQYRQQNLRKYLPLNLNPCWVSTHRGDKIMGVFCILRRKIQVQGSLMDAYHIRYLAAASDILISTAPDAVSGSVQRKQRKSPIRDAFMQVFEDPMVVDPERDPNAPCVYYAYIEYDNSRSIQMTANFGFSGSRTFSALPFSRFFPKSHAGITRIQDHEKPELRQHWISNFTRQSFFFDDHLFYLGQTYVCKVDGRIVASVNAINQHWQIESMPGFSGKLLLNVFPKLPFFSKILDPDNFRYVLFDQIYLENGFEDRLYPILETALADNKVNMGLIWADTESALASQVKADNKLGFIAAIKSEANAALITRFHHTDDKTKDFLLQNPLYLSALDMA